MDRDKLRTGSLLSNTNRVEAPYIRVSIGDYSFGVYNSDTKMVTNDLVVSNSGKTYPNYVHDLVVTKTNGVVNQYELTIIYPINENSDPNFFEKVLSTQSTQRKITFEYGDSLQPNHIYRDEEGIITNVKTNVDIRNSNITYKISAISASKLALSGSYTFPAVNMKPSERILEILYNPKYNLLDVYTGMRDRSLVEMNNLIAMDDAKVKIDTCVGMSVLEYISYLVSCMYPNGNSKDVIKSNFYTITTYDDVENIMGGTYFKVEKIRGANSHMNELCTYTIDIGYPNANIIRSFNINEDQNWALFYDYNMENSNSQFRNRIGPDGKLVKEYIPLVKNTDFKVTSADAVWWTKMTQYPINATLEIKGLLRPVVLMQYVKLNVWFYGHKHISSGYYIITEQKDKIGRSANGYFTSLKLLRVGGDEELV